MKRTTDVWVSLVSITFLICYAHAQDKQMTGPDQANTMIQLKASDWHERSAAFYESLNAAPAERQPDRIKLAIIGLLKRETLFLHQYTQEFERTGVPLGESYGDYHADLIQAVASLRDPRSIPALLGAISTGDMATQALAAFGTSALDPVIEKLKSRDAIERESAVGVLTEMLERNSGRGVSDPGSRAKIRDALFAAASDQVFYVRIAAVSGLARLRNPDARFLIQGIASNDPYKDEVGSYPVRAAAKEVLETLKNRETQ
jgi:hypothetical protein